MNRILAACAALAAAVSLASPAAAQFHTDVVYGVDTRIDLYQTADPKLLSLADSTVALFKSGDVWAENGVMRLATISYGEAYSLCKDEPFYEQSEGAFCSGSLVAPDVIMTAGHCVSSADDCAGTKFVFGFAVKEKGALPKSVPTGEVYGCKEVIGSTIAANGADWSLVRLDRKVAGHVPLELNRADAISAKAEVFVIGYPSGLPEKIAAGAHVRDASKPGYFTANLDTYGGNSGSPVFNAATNRVEGILVRGEEDYVLKGTCHVTNVCPVDGCRGEDVTKIANVADKISAADHESHVAALQPGIRAAIESLEAEGRP